MGFQACQVLYKMVLSGNIKKEMLLKKKFKKRWFYLASPSVSE